MANQQTQDRQLPAQSSASKTGSSLSVVNSEPPQQFLTRGGTQEQWSVLTKQFYPEAKSPDTVMLVVDYCRARKLDPMMKPFHIVPFYKDGVYVDSVVPGVNLYQITAHRTGQFVGASEPVYGPDKKFLYRGTGNANQGKEIVVATAEWCSVTVLREVKGEPRAFTARVYYDEFAAIVKGSKSANAGYPNENWRNKPRMMMSKCALSAALRLAFPEECGNEPTAEELEGQTIYTVDSDEPLAENTKDLMKDPATQKLAQAGKRGSANQKSSSASAPTPAGAVDPIVVEAESVTVQQEAPNGSVSQEPTTTEKKQAELAESATNVATSEAAPKQESASNAASTSSATTTNDDAIITAEDWGRLLQRGHAHNWLSLDITRLCAIKFNLPEDALSPHPAISMKEAKRIAAMIGAKTPAELLGV